MEPARGTRMGRFWDARAHEDAFYFVNSTLEYGAADSERFWASGPEDVDRILDLLGVEIEAGDSVVEIGCGVGRMTRPLASRAADVRALDVSAEMLRLARGHNPEVSNVEWIHGDGASLAPIPSESADACLSFVVFQHIPEPEVTLGYVREMGRVLRPGGWAAFQVSDAPRVHARRPLLSRARDRVASLRGRGPHGWSHPAWRGSAIDLARLRAVAADAGLACERTEGEGTQFCFVLARKRDREGR